LPAFEAVPSTNKSQEKVHAFYVTLSRWLEEKNDQVDCYCGLCLGYCNVVGASDGARADSSAGRHDHVSRLWLRPV
jgi:hypothetical protein